MTPIPAEPLKTLLLEEEGTVPYVYPDSLGFSTIATGHLVDHRKGGALSEPVMDLILEEDMTLAEAIVGNQITQTAFNRLTPVQVAVLGAMAFQLGKHTLEGFKVFTDRLNAGDVRGAAKAGRDSLWAHQTPARAEREMEILESGLWVPHK